MKLTETILHYKKIKFCSDWALDLYVEYRRKNFLGPDATKDGYFNERAIIRALKKWPFILIRKIQHGPIQTKDFLKKVLKNIDIQEFMSTIQIEKFLEKTPKPTKTTLLIPHAQNYENFDALLFVVDDQWYCLNVTQNEKKTLKAENLRAFWNSHKVAFGSKLIWCSFTPAKLTNRFKTYSYDHIKTIKNDDPDLFEWIDKTIEQYVIPYPRIGEDFKDLPDEIQKELKKLDTILIRGPNSS